MYGEDHTDQATFWQQLSLYLPHHSIEGLKQRFGDPFNAIEYYMEKIANKIIKRYGKNEGVGILQTIIMIASGYNVLAMRGGKLTVTTRHSILSDLKQDYSIKSEDTYSLMEFGNCWHFFRLNKGKLPYIPSIHDSDPNKASY